MTVGFAHRIRISVVVAAATALGSKTPLLSADERPPNLVLVMIDDLGKEWLSCYGAQDIETPRMDALAASGVRFDCAYSMPQCTPTRLTLLTGQYPYRHGWMGHWDVPRWGGGAHYDPNENPSLGRDIQALGYATCAAGKWQVNDFRVQPRAMADHGFDDWCMWTGFETGNPDSAARYADAYVHTPEGNRRCDGEFGPDVYTDYLIDFLTTHQDEPVFLYFPMALTHTPFVATPTEPDAEGRLQRHKAMVRYADRCVGRLVDAVDQLGLAEETVIVVTSDNGTATQISGGRTVDGETHAVQGAKAKLSEAGVCMPFIARYPGHLAPGVSQALIDFTDLRPTLVELAGGTTEPQSTDGRSFAPLLAGDTSESPRSWIASMGAHPSAYERQRVVPVHAFRERVIRTQHFKLHVNRDRTPGALFDLRQDPFEQRNLLPDPTAPEAVAALAELSAVAASMPARDAAPRYRRTPAQSWDLKKARKPADPRPNVVLIMADDLGWGDVSWNDSAALPKTPHLDRIAKESLVFERFYAQSPVCSPTRGSVLTGRHPFRYGITDANRGSLPADELTLPEVLRQQGYRTGHFGKWHLGTLTTKVKDSNRGGPNGAEWFAPPTEHGFDLFFSTEAKVPTFDPTRRPSLFPDGDWPSKSRGWFPTRDDAFDSFGTRYWSDVETAVDGPLRGDDSALVAGRAAEFMRKAVEQGEPFCAIVWFHAPHLPVVASDDDRSLYPDASPYEASYRGCITALDRAVGTLDATLRELGQVRDTLFAFTSDNGPEGNAKAPGSAGPFRGRKRSLFEGGVRVPSLMRWPSRWPEPRRVTSAACTSDYLPTIAAAVHVPLNGTLDGVDLAPQIEQDAPRSRPLGFVTRQMAAWHDGPWKMVGTRADGTWSWALYDLAEDPAERDDRADTHPERLMAMRTAFDAWRSDLGD